jgi:hypothetical protein
VAQLSPEPDEVALVVAAFISGGHVFLEDVPGTAKTMLGHLNRDDPPKTWICLVVRTRCARQALRRQRIRWLDLVDVSPGFGDRFGSGRCLIFHRRTEPAICSWAVSEGGLVRMGYGFDRIEQIAAQIDRYRQDLPFASAQTSVEYH